MALLFTSPTAYNADITSHPETYVSLYGMRLGGMKNLGVLTSNPQTYVSLYGMRLGGMKNLAIFTTLVNTNFGRTTGQLFP